MSGTPATRPSGRRRAAPPDRPGPSGDDPATGPGAGWAPPPTISATPQAAPAPAPPASGPPAPTAGPTAAAGTLDPAAPSDAPAPRLERPGSRVVGLPLRALVLAQVLVALLAVAGVRRDWTLGPAVAFVVLVVAGWAIRPGGVPLHRRVRTRTRYLLRRRDVPALQISGAVDPAVAPLLALRPGLVVEAFGLRNGARLGILFDGTGWTSAIAVRADPTLVAGNGSGRQIPAALLTDLLQVDDIRLSSLHLQVRTVPAPSPTWTPNALPRAALAYRQINRPGAAAGQDQVIWLRIEPDLCHDAIQARGGGVEGAHRVLKRVVSRAAEVLEAAGVPGQILDDRALLSLLGRDCPPMPGRPALRETWTETESTGQTHLSWWVTGWPVVNSPVTVLLQHLPGVPASSATIVFSWAPGHGRAGSRRRPPRLRTVLRVTCPDSAAAGSAAAAVTQVAADAGVGLRRLDGDQGPAFAATVPLGGTAPGRRGLRLPAHEIPTTSLSGFDVPLISPGVVLGLTAADEPLVVQVFRDLATQVALIGSETLAHLLAFRALAIGARVEVATTDPTAWGPVAALASPGRMVFVGPTAGFPHDSGPSRPLLRIDEVRTGPVEPRPGPGPWQTRVALAPTVDAAATEALARFDLLLLQRVPAAVSEALSRGLRLSEALAAELPRLPDDVLLLAADRQEHLVGVALGPAEVTALAGPAVPRAPRAAPDQPLIPRT